MEKHPIGDMISATMEKIKELVDVNTVVGQPISAAEGLTIIPISKVSYGFGAGGGDYNTSNFGGGVGAAANVTPIAFLIINGTNARVISIPQGDITSFDKLIDAAPELIDKIASLSNKDEKAE